MRKEVILIFIFITVFFLNACNSICESFGARDLGNNLTLLAGDRAEDRVIVDKNIKIDLRKCEEINCDSIIQSHIIGPLDFANLRRK